MAKKYTVTMKLQWDPATKIQLYLDSNSEEWGGIAAPYRQGNQISIPDDQFHFESRVPDERRYLYAVNTMGEPELIACRACIEENRSEQRPIVLVLESPHLHEYRYTDDSGNPAFIPLGPLMNPKSNTKVKKYLPAMLQAAGVQPLNQVIILSNPVPFQASIVRLWERQPQQKMLSTVRNSIWRKLYKVKHQNKPVMEADFKARLKEYRPSVIINACTDKLEKTVSTTLKKLKLSAYTVYEAGEHASSWDKRTKLTLVFPKP